MPFPWSDLGPAPAADVPEISVFGPGFGECVVAHLGHGRWIVVDSCTEPSTGLCVPTTYLDRLGADPGNSVELVIASHWHDDHVRGLSEVVKNCRNAKFVSASVLTKPEFYKFVARISGGNLSSAGSGANEFHRIHGILAERSPKKARLWAAADRRLQTFPKVGTLPSCDVWSLSPSDEEYERFLTALASEMPSEQQPKRRAVTQEPNDTSVVIGLDWGPGSALLGSDLEAFPGATRGWGAIVASAGRPQGKASYLKIPHHGGNSAHHDGMWSQMLHSQPNSVLTPFSRGKGLPSREDCKRILGLTSNAYTTADHHSRSTPVGDRSVEKMLAEAKIRLTQSPQLGLVRSRFVGSSWQVQLFNQARPLSA